MGKGGEATPALKKGIERHPRLKPIPKVLYEDAATNVPSTPYYDALNRRVDEIGAKARAVAREPEIHVLVAGDGALVYPNRIVATVMGAVAFYLCTTAPRLSFLMLPAMYLGYDFYSGVLHAWMIRRTCKVLNHTFYFRGAWSSSGTTPSPTTGPRSRLSRRADLNIIVLILMVLNCVCWATRRARARR